MKLGFSISINKKIIMKNLNLLFILILVSLNYRCTDNQIDTSEEQFYFDINESTFEWIEPFKEKGQLISYSSQTNELTELELCYVSDLETENHFDCQRNNMTVQCEYQTIAITFSEIFEFENQPICISIGLFGENRVIVMPNCCGGSIVKASAILNDSSDEISTSDTEKYHVEFIANYDYNGNERNAMIIENKSIEDLRIGGIIPPKRLILVKGIGITEWEDHTGNIWKLN